MLETILLDDLYLADYLEDHIETIYSNYNKTTTISHSFKMKNKKYVFIRLVNSNNKFKGFLNIYNKKIYSLLEYNGIDFEITFKDDDLENIEKASIRKSCFINFEPLKNYSSKYIKPEMTLKQIGKVLNDINTQIFKENKDVKVLQKIA